MKKFWIWHETFKGTVHSAGPVAGPFCNPEEANTKLEEVVADFQTRELEPGTEVEIHIRIVEDTKLPRRSRQFSQHPHN